MWTNTAYRHSFQNETGLWNRYAYLRVSLEPALALEQRTKRCGYLSVTIALVACRK
jgi:hypothetical protein